MTRTEVVALDGAETLEEITLRNRDTPEERQAKTHWLFICIGGVPHTEWAAEVGVIRDEEVTLSPASIYFADARAPPLGRSTAIRPPWRRARRVYSQRETFATAP